MSFRDNLQHLRATRNMTQEQLAMLVGVFRQSVTKWESERAYPEMDKLLKLCQIFDCSLDDLVTGDLTGIEPDPAMSAVPSGPPTDICGYDEHAHYMVWHIPTGVAFFILGLAVTILIGEDGYIGRIPAESLEPLGIFIGALIGLVFLIPAGRRQGF